ncbi:MAG: outer-membrane lipoprotein carrier protein LolA [Holophagaceae bacterium]|uniref:Outer-membrane lipoprotein carrier protein LolA n=1 Tax=Candidatus Geothrix skivensis TaxID=2954439 RepID=A0A9D7SGA5_9BACT|nr:outer-membrane lipoprotein carrier protein LolA [Candidatus Geothrix skivensis]
MRLFHLVLVAALPAWGAAPSWWIAFTKVPALESRFRQESDSAVFGKLAREGRLAMGRGGRLKVSYQGGLTVTCDGRHLVQYDPDTRTAQRVELARAVRDFPLLGILLDPARLERLYRLEVYGGETLKLLPKEAGLPELKATGRKGLLRTLEWTDPTGARQKLELLDPRVPASLAPGTFRIEVPAGTRWSTPNG